MSSTKTVARFGNVWQLLEYADYEISPICNLPFMSGDYVQSNGYIVAGISGHLLTIFVIDDYLKKGELEVVELPDNFVVHSLVIGGISKRRIYIGGKVTGGEGTNECQSIYYIDLECKDYSLEPFPLPKELMRPGKAIDDIGLYGYKIYVLDNVILPKYLYIFGVKELDLQEIVPLHPNGTYESYYRIAINIDYIVLLSSTVGDGGGEQHLSFYSRENPKFISTLTFFVFDPVVPGRTDLLPRFNDLLLVKNKLIIAADKGGVVKFDLSQDDAKVLFKLTGKTFEDEDEEFDMERWSTKREKEKKVERLKRERFSRPFIGNAVSVQPLYKDQDSLKAILVTVFDRGVYRTELEHLSDGGLV